MERNVMGELNVYRGSGAKPNFSEIARRHGMDRHTVAKYWREGESAADGRSARGSAFDPLEEEIRAKAQLPGMTKGRLGARGGQARGEGQPGEGGVHTGHQREVHLDAGEGPKGAQAHKEGLRGMGRGRTSARLGQAGLRGRAQNGF